MLRSKLAALAITVLAALGLAAAGTASAVPASAATNVTGTTWLADNGDSGNGSANSGIWADDAFHRVLNVTDSSACTVVVSSFHCYAATVADTGTFRTLPGNGRAPNPNSVSDPGLNIAWPPVTGTFSGSVSYVFESDETPAEAAIPNTLNNSGTHPSSGPSSTSDWYLNAFSDTTLTHFRQPNGTAEVNGGALQNTWTFSYTTMTGKDSTHNAVACEKWTDAASNSGGSTTDAGNVTGKQCAGTPIPVPQGDLGDFVNAYGNGLDVFRQHYAAGAIVAGWTATQSDPATLWIRHDTGLTIGGNTVYTVEATRSGGHATGLCLSNPMGGWSDPAGPTGLLIVHCAGNPQANKFQQFYLDGGTHHLISVINGQAVSPHGTGAQLTASGVAPWPGGSDYRWMDKASLPG